MKRVYKQLAFKPRQESTINRRFFQFVDEHGRHLAYIYKRARPTGEREFVTLILKGDSKTIDTLEVFPRLKPALVWAKIKAAGGT